jgi:retron-type reverse transcriptase
VQGTGADRPVVAMKPGNAGGAKGAGHPGERDGQPPVREEPEHEPKSNGKPFVISKRMVWEAWRQVRANQGAAGVDGQSIAEFEADLSGNLYRLWNRMSSGSYMPPPVRAVEIPKAGTGVRVLGVPTVADRVAQTVAKLYLEPLVEPVFHTDSYGYRPGRSAHDAIARCRERCWRNDWAIDLDVRSFFDTLDHSLVLRAVAHHTTDRWVLLYVQRWLQAPLQREDGTLSARDRGTPQGSAISPVLANIFLHVCPERKVRRCRRSFCDPCCASDGGRSSGFAVQAGSPNRRDVMPVKSRGGKRLRKRLANSGSGMRREDEHG